MYISKVSAAPLPLTVLGPVMGASDIPNRCDSLRHRHDEHDDRELNLLPHDSLRHLIYAWAGPAG